MKKKRVVIPENMGRGIKANTAKAQYEVDLTDYVDGSTVTYTNGKLGVNVPASISSVSTTGAIEGDGSSTNPVKLEFNDSIVKGIDGKYGVAETGLTCASIDELPEKPWKKGTTILAKQDGTCVRLAALDSIFQEIGVGITADKTNSFTNEEYNVVVTVSNTGESTNELTNLNIVGPEITPNYTVKNVRVGNSGADEVERVDDFTYNIKGLRKGSTVNVRFTVVPKANGTYQFTAAVNPNSALDKDLGNNSATLILSASTKVDPTYVPSVDCPLITATELDHNTVLQQLSPEFTLNSNGVNRKAVTVNAKSKTNIFSQRRTLKGLRINLDGASTVIGYKNSYSDGFNGVVVGNVSTVSAVVSGDINSYILFDADVAKSGSDGYTFSNGVLEITADLPYFVFACRPQGNNCRWQMYAVYATVPATHKEISTTNVTGATVTKRVSFLNSVKLVERDRLSIVVIPTSDQNLLYTDYAIHGVNRANPANIVDKLIVTVQAGTAASLSYTSTNNYAVTEVQGKTTITKGTITVSADAKATDSVNTPYIQVIVEE
nr:MAG TPA: Translocon-associated protein beta (TRAPB) [Caudoviricetes sp.]